MHCITVLAQQSVTQMAVVTAFACVCIVSTVALVMLLRQWRRLR